MNNPQVEMIDLRQPVPMYGARHNVIVELASKSCSCIGRAIAAEFAPHLGATLVSTEYRRFGSLQTKQPQSIVCRLKSQSLPFGAATILIPRNRLLHIIENLFGATSFDDEQSREPTTLEKLLESRLLGSIALSIITTLEIASAASWEVDWVHYGHAEDAKCDRLVDTAAWAIELFAGNITSPLVIAVDKSIAQYCAARALRESCTNLRRTQMSRELCNSILTELTVELGRTKLTMRELATLAPGDVIVLSQRRGEDLVASVNGHQCILGREGQARGRLAIRMQGTSANLALHQRQ